MDYVLIILSTPCHLMPKILVFLGKTLQKLQPKWHKTNNFINAPLTRDVDNANLTIGRNFFGLQRIRRIFNNNIRSFYVDSWASDFYVSFRIHHSLFLKIKLLIFLDILYNCYCLTMTKYRNTYRLNGTRKNIMTPRHRP